MAAPTMGLLIAEALGPRLMDGVILIRPMTLDDVDAHVEGHDPEQARWLSGFPSTPEAVAEWVQNNAEHWENDGPIFNFGIVEVATSRLVGMIDANTDAENMGGVEDGQVNISYVIYPSARGHRYAARAVNLVLAFLDEKQFSSAVIRASEKNGRSVRVAARCGFVCTGEVLSYEPAGLTMLSVFQRALR
jgi:RimJ/RimL family protein N-acetyltransferase